MPVLPYRARNLGFGYMLHKSPNAQLQAVLKLKNNNEVYEVIRNNIKRLSEKHMDLKLMAAEQQANVHAIETGLKEQHPEIFATEESEKRLFFVSHLVYHMHNQRRHYIKRKQLAALRRARATGNHTAPILLSTQGTSQSVSQGPSRVTRSHTAANSQSTQRMSRSVSQGSSRPSTAPTLRVTHNQREGQQSELDSQELQVALQPEHHNLVNVQGMPQSVSQCPIDTKPDVTLSLSSFTAHEPARHPDQYRAVYDFLQASSPPMTHLMDAFIDFGCVNTDFLRAMSKWPFERIGCFLDQLSPGGHDGKLTGMEKFILQNHLEDYFA